jgi:aryl carrier-like protein
LAGYLESKLPAALVPSYWMKLEQLPLTANGKLDRKNLPAPEATRRESDYQAPRTDAEQALARVYAHVLGQKQVGIGDDFFELGGDSIKAIQIVARMRNEGYEVSVADVFRHPKIEQLGDHVQRAVAQLQEGAVEGTVVATPIQRWFLEAGHPQRSHWNQAVVLRRAQGYDREIVTRALRAIVDHHDALGAVLVGDQLSYLKRGERPVVVEQVEVRGDEWRAELAAAATQLQASMDLAQPPLIKAAVCTTPEGGYLLVVVHHLVIDGVSWRILIEDLESAYVQLEQGQTATLPARTHSFKMWAERLAAYAATDEASRQYEYWHRICTEPCVDLPGDRDQRRSALRTRSRAGGVDWSGHRSRPPRGPRPRGDPLRRQHHSHGRLVHQPLSDPARSLAGRPWCAPLPHERSAQGDSAEGRRLRHSAVPRAVARRRHAGAHCPG